MSAKGPDIFGQLSGGVLTLECAGMLKLDSGPDLSPNLPLIILLDNTRFSKAEIPTLGDLRKFLKNYYGRKEKYIKLVPFSLFSIGDSSLWGLILKPTNRNKGEFERIGTFREFGDRSTLIRRLNSGSKAAQKYCAEWRRNLETGSESYMITIVLCFIPRMARQK